jgi:oligopeptide/dipeptide ABC transporter ATP-binding protein
MDQTESDVLLRVADLNTRFTARQGVVRVLDDLSFTLTRGRITGLVGESGSGKSVTAMSILRLVRPPGEITSGTIEFEGDDLLKLGDAEMARIRGRQIGMIFQQPRSSLNPVFRIGDVLLDILRIHRGLRGVRATNEAHRLLESVGLSDPSQIMRSYPHQLSGGMCQRVMIAQVLACEPELLIADEATTALDVTIQMQIVQLLLSLRESTGLTMLVITHDLGLVGELCDDVLVMYAGEILERAPVVELFDNPTHPYTRGLLASRANRSTRSRLYSIPGSVPNLIDPPAGCRFHPRCPFAKPICSEESPAPSHVKEGHWVRCHFWKEVADAGPDVWNHAAEPAADGGAERPESS